MKDMLRMWEGWGPSAGGYEHKGEVIPDRVVIDELQQGEVY